MFHFNFAATLNRQTLSFFFCALCALFVSSLPLNAQTITTVAGVGTHSGYAGDGSPATTAWLNIPDAVAVDAKGNMYIADQYNYCIRKVNAAGIITTITGDGSPGFSPDGTPATAAEIGQPDGIAIDTFGNVYFAVRGLVRKINTAGILYTFAGGGITGGDGGPATDAALYDVYGLAFDKYGNLFMADGAGNNIRKVNTSGIISTVAGTGVSGYTGDGGPATNATFHTPIAVALDDTGNVYVSDFNNYVIRKVDTAGIISTFAGTGSGIYGGDGGPATAAGIEQPWGIAVDGKGNVYIADVSYDNIRVVNAAGIINQYAGMAGMPGFYGDGGPALSAEIFEPNGIALDGCGNLYIAESDNFIIRKVSGISGSSVLCVGDTANLINNEPGGVWSSGSTGIATVNPSTGHTTAIAPGTSVITYKKGLLMATAVITVNPLPVSGSITGLHDVCIANDITLTSSAPGGTWSTFNTDAYVVGGVVSGMSAGIDTVYYSVFNSCGTAVTSFAVSVNPLPVSGSISGNSFVCLGATIAFTSALAGGVWGSITGNATVTPASVTGTSPGPDTVTYIVTNSCGTAETKHPIVVFTADQCDSVAYVKPIAVPSDNLQIYPNPNKGSFTVILSSGIDEDVQITITNVVGQHIKELTTHANQHNYIKLDEGSGIYFISATASGGHYLRQIVVE